MPGYEILIMLAVVVLLAIAALFAVPRVMRAWAIARPRVRPFASSKPNDESA